MADRHPIDAWIDFWVGVTKVVTPLVIIGGIIGAFYHFGNYLLGNDGFDPTNGWICLGIAAFASLFRLIYPPVIRHLIRGFK